MNTSDTTRAGDDTRPRDFSALLALEPHGPDTFVGVSPPYTWGRIYGGQVIAQALYAAAATVPNERPVHSLHAYFILGGRLDEPVRFEVDRVRNGRSFMTRRVVARQSYGAILTLEASFHVDEPGPDRGREGLAERVACTTIHSSNTQPRPTACRHRTMCPRWAGAGCSNAARCRARPAPAGR